MPSEVLGLFTTPDQYQLAQQQAQEAQARKYAQLDPRAQAQYGFFRGGQQLAGAIGGALGIEDPQLKKIAMRQQLASQLNPNDINSYKATAKAAIDAGDQEFAMAIADAGRKAEADMALIQQRTAEKMTGEQRNSIAYADTVATKGTPEWNEAFQTKFEQLTTKAETTSNEQKNAASLADAKGLKRGTPEWNTEFQNQMNRLTTKELKPNIKDVGVADKTREVVYFDENTSEQFVMKPSQTDPTKLVRVPYSGGIDKTTAKVSATSSSKGSDEGAKTIAELSAKRVDAAKVSAGKAMEQAGLLQELLKTPQPISGSGAPARVGALRVFSTFGLTSPKDDEALGNADKFNALAGERVISFIKALGSNPTDTDREFARTIGPALEKGTKTNADLINFLLERARKVVKDADSMENYFYDNNYSLRGYKSPFMTDLEIPKSNGSLKSMSDEQLIKEAQAKGLKVKPRTQQ